jgi:hypothetical protein
MSWSSPIDHTFFLCDPVREPERAKYLQTWLQIHGISPTTYTMGLHCYKEDITPDIAERVYNPWIDRGEQDKNFNRFNLKQGEISLVLNWADVAKTAVAKGYKTVMILESDVLFDDHFLQKLSIVLQPIQNQTWDFLSISARDDLRPKRNPGDTNFRWFQVKGPIHTRTTDAMIFRVPMLEKILSTLFPFAEVLDWELNYQLTRHSSVSLWLDPPIVRQGSGAEYTTTL